MKNILDLMQSKFPEFEQFISQINEFTQAHKRVVYVICIMEILLGVSLLIHQFQPQIFGSFVKISPKTYALSKFNPKIRYVLKQGDFIKGKTVAGNKIKIIFTSPRIVVKTQVDSKGVWNYQIPEDFVLKRYRMAVIVFDKNGKNPQVSYYRIRVETNNKILMKIRGNK